jgi:hypothetical protein
MLCAACGVENPEYANFCVKCGSAFAAVSEVAVVGVPHTILTDAPAAFYHPSPASKVFLLSALSFGIYPVFWFWMQWRAEDPNEGRAWTLFRTLLCGFFFYGMAREVQEEAWRRELRSRYSPAVLTAWIWICPAAIRYAPEVWKVVAIWVAPVPLMIVQTTINRINDAGARRGHTGWRWWETVIAFVLGLFWILVFIGMIVDLFGLDPSASTNNG